MQSRLHHQKVFAAYWVLVPLPLFKAVFDEFNGTALPEEVGLRNLFATKYQMVPDRIAPAVKVLLDSAEQAGFFRVVGNRSRMVIPPYPQVVIVGPSGPTKSMDIIRSSWSEPHAEHSVTASPVADVGTIPKEFLGLLRGFPPSGTTLSDKKRTALVKALVATAEWIYPSAEEDGAT